MSAPKSARMADIITLAAQIWEIPVATILSKSRKRDVIRARSAIIAVAYDQPRRLSYPEMARVIGYADHTTAIHAHKRNEDHCKHIEGHADKVKTLRRRAATEGPFVTPVEIAYTPPRKTRENSAVRNKRRHIAKVLESQSRIEPVCTVKRKNQFLSGDDEIVDYRINQREGSATMLAAINAHLSNQSQEKVT